MDHIGFAALGLNMSVVTVTAAATTIVAASSTRQALVLRNQGDNDCWLGTATTVPTATNTGGWLLAATDTAGDGKGEAFALQNPSSSLEIQGICEAGKTTTVVVWS